MATATKKTPTPLPPRDGDKPQGATTPKSPLVLRVFDSVFRFLASLKLAVICLATLAGTLAYGTKFNSDYGLNAANDYIYQTKGFALLMAFLGTNILCAALIRYPWVKRQTGFLITHLGLLVVIGGSWWASQTADEGLLGMLERQTSSSLVRSHKPVIYVKPVDPHTGKPTGEYRIPFHPGAFDWTPGRFQVVSQPSDPFKLAVKGFYAASIPKVIFVPDPAGPPMVKLRPRVIPPGQKAAVDVFPTESERWFAIGSGRARRAVKDAGPAQFVFSLAERPEVFADFLTPPADPGTEGVARLHYVDKAGKDRTFEVRVDDAKPGVPIPLPESDLTASFAKVVHVPIEDPAQRREIGEDVINIVQFNVRKGDGPEVEHNGFASLPNVPAVIPRRDDPAGETPKGLVQVGYFCPPVVDGTANGKFGVIEVMADDGGRLAYRVFERGTPAKLKAHGLIAKGKEITAFGGNAATPMTMTLTVEDFLQGGRREIVAESVDLPPSKRDDAMGAILAELTVGGVTRDIWLRKSPDFEIDYKTVAFPDSMYEVAFDVDRLDLGFSLTLDDFDVGFDPGTSQASSFKSEVRLTDEASGIKDQPHSIFMNHTLDYKGWRFFQTNYSRYLDPKTGRETGEFVSVFQVAKNPARGIIYAGCVIVVLGAFVQFYMRAGIFTDGGKRERERNAAKARLRLEAKANRSAAPTLPAAEPDRDEIEPL